ncbi:MAG: hypothetical protein GTO08_07065 [Deltaproteobacteria bacterium]|nr:hypothetical protein [Deltaproteobacteria bacterium]
METKNRIKIKRNTLFPLLILSFIAALALYRCGGEWRGLENFTYSVFSPLEVNLTWEAPATNVDGTPVTDLAGFKIYIGPSSGSYTDSIDVGNVYTYTLEDLPSGTLYFCVTAYDTMGNESDFSNEGSKTLN